MEKFNDKESEEDRAEEISAIKLQDHIKNYVPKIWKESIGTVSHYPHIPKSDFLPLKKAYLEGNLESFMSKLQNGIYNKWYIIEAIKNFFETQDK